MALNSEELDQARALLIENERRLRIRDRQIERYGDNVAPDIVLDAEDIRKKIVALKAVLEPELSDEISGLVKRRLEDDYFIFQQTLGAKQDVALLREDVAAVKTAQGLAATWRMQTDEWKAGVDMQLQTSESKRSHGAAFYRAGLLIAITAGALALALAVALAARILGS